MPQLAHAWFDGEYVSAFDDNISITAPCKTEFEGGITGLMLARMVEKTTSAEIEARKDKNAVAFKGGRTDFKFGLMDIRDRPFEAPKPKRDALIKAKRKVLNRQLRFCMESVGHDVTHPEWCGITFEAAGDEIVIFSGYAQVLARATVPVEAKPKFKRVILHEKFCQQLINYPSAELELHDTHALLVDKEAGVTVFGRSLGSGSSLDLQDMAAVALDRAGNFVELPDISAILDRAAIFEGDHLNMKLAVIKQGKTYHLRMISESGDGKLIDITRALSAPLPEIEVNTNAKHLVSGADLREFTVGSDEIIMRDEDALLVVAVLPAE